VPLVLIVAGGRMEQVEAVVAEGTSTALWQGLVRDAQARASRQLGDDLESYLVFTLMRHQADARLAGRTMAIEWLETLLCSGRKRENGLRDVGDGCLLIAGLFPEQAQRRRVSLSYFQDIGSDAYRHLGSIAGGGLDRLFRQLAAAFAELVRVLFELRRLAGGEARLDPGLAYAWCESHGRIVPERAADAFPGAIVLEGPRSRQ
jgi:hypothetical protein